MRRCVLGVAIAILIAGSVTFAQTQGRTEHYSIGPIADTGYPVGHCAGFDVLTDYVFLMTGVVRSDKSGQPVADRYQFKVLGESLYYNSNNVQKSVAGGPGEVENQRLDPKTGFWSGSGVPFKIRIPGYGLIFVETGHFVYDRNAGKFLFNSGHNQMIGEDLEALCDYLK